MRGDWEVDINFLESLARYAGDKMLNARKGQLIISTKSSDVDLVTQIDVDIETNLKTRISKAFPDHKFLCEESYTAETLSDAPTWIIDPIDGTTNFIHNCPLYCVSIGFSRNKQILLGCIFIPTLDEMFYAIKGGGAYLNGQKISVSGCENISQALLFTAFNISEIHENINSDNAEYKKPIMTRTLTNLQAVLPKIRDIRLMGSSAIELSYLACGRCDLIYQFGPKEWDIAAGILLVQEAGGYICDIDGSEYIDIGSRRILAAANMNLAKNLSQLLKM